MHAQTDDDLSGCTSRWRRRPSKLWLFHSVSMTYKIRSRSLPIGILFRSANCRLQPAKKSQITPIACPIVKKPSLPHDSSEHSTNAVHRTEILQQRRQQRQSQKQTSLALSATTCVVKLIRPPVPPISHPSSHLRAPRAAGRPAHVSKIITSFSVQSSEAHTATHERAQLECSAKASPGNRRSLGNA